MTSLLQSQQLSSNYPDYISNTRNDLSDSEYRLFLLLFSADCSLKTVFFSHSHMAIAMNSCVSSIKRWLKALRDKGYLIITYRGYLKTNVYKIPYKYLINRCKFYSIYKNFLNISILGLKGTRDLVYGTGRILWSKTKGKIHASGLALKANELLLKDNEIIYPAKGENLPKNEGKMLQLNREQCEERSSYPKWVQDRALAIYNRKAAKGVKIIDHAKFFMGILRSEAAARQRPAGKQQPKENNIAKKIEKRQRPADGSYSVAKPGIRKHIDSDLEISLKSEKSLHSNPNTMSSFVADLHFNKLTKDQQWEIYTSVHVGGCHCRLAFELENKKPLPIVTKPIEPIVSHNDSDIMSTPYEYTSDYEEIEDFVL